MRKWIAVLVAGTLVVGGAAMASAQTTEAPPRPEPLVVEVLEGLVDDGVITQQQADAIVAALDEAREARREERQARRELMRSLWEDGVLTAEEIAQLPEPNPFTDPDGPFAEALDDGELTAEEMRDVIGAYREARRAQRETMREFLADGVVTADELAQLPEDHPLRDPDGPAAEFLEDGQLTADELAQLRPRRPFHRPGPQGWPGRG